MSPAQTTHELNMVEAARAVGVRVVKLSVWRADEGLSPIARLHRPVEQSLVTSGLPWTILRPNFYLQNFLRQPSIREVGEFSLPLITAPISFIDIGDIARVAARVLTTDGHDGCVYDLTGPEALTYAEAAEGFSDNCRARFVVGQAQPPPPPRVRRALSRPSRPGPPHRPGLMAPDPAPACQSPLCCSMPTAASAGEISSLSRS